LSEVWNRIFHERKAEEQKAETYNQFTDILTLVFLGVGEKEAKKHPFKARNPVQNTENKAQESHGGSAKREERSVTYEKKDTDVRTYVPEYKPKKVYGKAPGRQKTAASLGDRRREDAEKKAERYGRSSDYKSGSGYNRGYNNQQGSKGKQYGTSRTQKGGYTAHGKGGKTK
jgi:hypothetical protein